MFEQSYNVLEMQIAMRYGKDGIRILQVFRYNETLDIINNMSDEDLKSFYQIMENNFIKIESLLDTWDLKELLDEERFDYDSFYHNCYKKLSKLINENKYRESKDLAMAYRKVIANIRKKIASPFDIKKFFSSSYEVRDKRKNNLIKKVYQIKNFIEKYFGKFIIESGFTLVPKLSMEDIFMLIESAFDGLNEKDVLSNLSFLHDQKDLLERLRMYEEEFKEILSSLVYTENNILATLNENFSKEDLAMYLYVYDGLNNTKPINEENLLNNIYRDGCEEEVLFLLKQNN